MTLALDQLLCVTELLANQLPGARVRSVRQTRSHPDTLVIELRQQGENLLLLVDPAPDTARIHLVSEREPAPGEPSPFTMLLRKHLEGGLVSDLRAHHDDRIVHLDVSTRDGAVTLTAELFGPGSNLHLHRDGHLLGSWNQRLAATQERLAGGAWQPPPPPQRTATRAPAGLPAGPELHAALEAHYSQLRQRLDSDRLRARLTQLITRAQRRALRTREAVEQDLARAAAAPALRHEADLLQAVRSRLPRGADHAVVHDWALDPPAERTLSLDPATPIADQIESRYRRARRLEAAADRVLDRMIAIDGELETIATARRDLEAASTVEALEALLRSCDADPAFRSRAGAAQRGHGQSARRAADAPRLPYHELRSSDGYRILVGRGARDNDRLTLQVARGRDLWLHARDFAGSHVVIPRPDTRPVPERTIEEAAQLAAWNSRGRTDSLVEVTLLERKHVSKPRGLPPGRVQLAAGGRTVLVRPDEALVRELFRSGEPATGG